jgi:aspartokinase
MTREPVEHPSQNCELQSQANPLLRQNPLPHSAIGSVKSIEFKKSISVATIISTRKLPSFVFLQKVFELFEQHTIGFDFVTISEIAVSVVLDTKENLSVIERNLSGIGNLKIEANKATVCLSFTETQSKGTLSGRIFQTIEGVNVSFITQSDAGKKLAFVINESEMDIVAFTLFEQFFEKNKSAVAATSNLQSSIV